MTPSLNEEKKLWQRGYKFVAGLDEVGRGPLAGPVVAAAVVISPPNSKFKIPGLRDSKQLTAAKRENFYKLLTKSSFIKWGIGRVSEKVIDKINIKNASELAMAKALKNLRLKPDFLIIDGNHISSRKLKAKKHRLMVKADEKVFSCAASSIIAKVYRDRLMEKYHQQYPRYGFNRHKGYATAHHLAMLKKNGACGIHRKSFRYGSS